MKLNLEFEGPDLRDLIEEYFKHRGFKVKNLAALCLLFEKAYPDGITVKAETVPQENQPITPVPEPAEPASAAGLKPSEEEDPILKKDNGQRNTAMSATDLFDPTPGLVPTRDEQLRQSQAEVARIVAQSKALEEEKAKEDS